MFLNYKIFNQKKKFHVPKILRKLALDIIHSVEIDYGLLTSNF